MSLSTGHLRSQLGRLADTAIVPTELADRARQRARRDRARIATVAALIVVLAAAGSLFVIRNLVQTRSLPAARYEMPYGLRTPAGTTQLGPVFVQSTYVQFTVFQVSGDPYAVFRDLAGQLRRAGFAAAPGSLICGISPIATSPTATTPTTTVVAPWTCDAGAERRTSRDDMVTMSMVVSLDDGPYQGELVIATASAPLVRNDPVPIYRGQMFDVPPGPAIVQPDPPVSIRPSRQPARAIRPATPAVSSAIRMVRHRSYRLSVRRPAVRSVASRHSNRLPGHRSPPPTSTARNWRREDLA